MAILSTTEILSILKEPRNPDIVGWREEHNTLEIYVNGGDVHVELEKIKTYENDSQYQLRKDIAKSTKDKVSDLLKPISKVFNATGGSIHFEGLSEKETQDLQELIDLLPEGMTIEEWMEAYLVEAIVTDPNGVILVETGNEKTNSEGKAYPTYKSTNVIHDYQTTWDDFEYLVLLHKKVRINDEEKQIFRVFDDEKDALYYLDNTGDSATLREYESDDEEHKLTHNLGFVPAVVCGSIVNKNTKGKRSFLHKIDERLVEFLSATSVFSIYKFLHLFPRFWSYAMKCVTCDAEGFVLSETQKNEDGTKKKVLCPTCDGKRLKVNTDVSDQITLPIPEEGQAVLGGNMAGFVDLPNNAWEQMTEDLRSMQKDMEFALWGAYLVDRDDKKERTATESHINVQPINDQLCVVSRWVETKQSQVLTFMARIMSQNEKAKVVSSYGKRFIVESPDTLWEKYIEAKQKSAPITTLDSHYDEYLMSRYQNNLQMYETQKKMFNTEPMAHYSLAELKDIATKEQLQKKIIYSQWITTDINWETDIEKLKIDFDTYYESNVPELETAPSKPILQTE